MLYAIMKRYSLLF